MSFNFFPRTFSLQRDKMNIHKSNIKRLKRLTFCTWHNRFTDWYVNIAYSAPKCWIFRMCVSTSYQLAFSISSLFIGWPKTKKNPIEKFIRWRVAHEIVKFIIHHMESHISNRLPWLKDPFLGTQFQMFVGPTNEHPNKFQMCAWNLYSVCTLTNKIKIKTQMLHTWSWRWWHLWQCDWNSHIAEEKKIK